MNPLTIRFIIFIPIALCMILSCDKNLFAPSTDVGQKIVDDFDPSMTNVNENIKTFSGNAVIDSSFSMRDIDDTVLLWSHRNMPAVLAGTFPGIQSAPAAFHDTAYAYIEFRTGIFRQPGQETNRNNIKSAHSIDSVVLSFNRYRITIDSTYSERPATAKLDVYVCDTVKDSDIVAFSKDKIAKSSEPLGTFSVGLDSLAEDTVYSIKLDSTYKIRFQRAASDSQQYAEDTAWFAFCLKPAQSSSGVVRFDNLNDAPRIDVFYRTDSTDTVLKAVTLYRHHSTFTVFEQDSASACSYPVASWETGRRAVFKLDVSSLREYMDTATGTDKKFVVIQRADMKLKLAGFFFDLQEDSAFTVIYSLFDTLAHTMSDFTAGSSFYVKNTGSKDTTYTLPVAPWLQKIIVQNKSDVAFLYLTAPLQYYTYSPPFLQLDWTQPAAHLELNAVITNPR